MLFLRRWWFHTQAAKEDTSGALPASANVTLGFNQARVQEAAGDTQAAARSYRAMLDAFPAYTDCHLRLACIAKHRGDLAGALKLTQKALEAKPGLPDALAMQGARHCGFSLLRMIFSCAMPSW